MKLEPGLILIREKTAAGWVMWRLRGDDRGTKTGLERLTDASARFGSRFFARPP
jgi:hypothetical protein